MWATTRLRLALLVEKEVMAIFRRIDPRRLARRHLCDALAVAACTWWLSGIVAMTPGIALGQSTSARSCTPAAFTGRVGPARPSLCQRRARPTPGPRGRRGHAGVRGPAGLAGLPGPGGAEGLHGLLGATGPAGLTGATGMSGSTGSSGAPGAIGLTGATGATGFAGLPDYLARRDQREQPGCRASPDLKDKPDPKAKQARRASRDPVG